jgi:hypothetical protein
MFKIHVKAPGMHKAKSLGADGKLTNLSIYTILYKTREAAESEALELSELNPGWSFTVVPANV